VVGVSGAEHPARKGKRPLCTPQSYLKATVGYLRRETPERIEELLGLLPPKQRREFEAEITRQEAEARP
jgi:hypothetical protein